jgi:DNA-binding LytR/AlgR family response regulator
MDPLKILIVEDELIAAIDLKETLEAAGHKITAIARTFDEALKAVMDKLPDIAIIDILLSSSKADGIHTAKELQSKYDFPIIYLTGDQEKETFSRAKETLPSAYILKPFKQKELPYQVELAYYYYKLNQKSQNDPKLSEYIFLPSAKELKKIAKKDVVYLKAGGSYVHVFVCNEDKPFTFSMNMGYLSQFFPNNFYLLSRSYFVNLDYIESVDNQFLKLMGVSEKIPIPDAKRSELLRKLPIVRTP